MALISDSDVIEADGRISGVGSMKMNPMIMGVNMVHQLSTDHKKTNKMRPKSVVLINRSVMQKPKAIIGPFLELL